VGDRRRHRDRRRAVRRRYGQRFPARPTSSSVPPASGRLQTKIVAPTAPAGDSFGAAVAVNADTVLVGAPLDDLTTPTRADAGSASFYVCTGTAWALGSKVSASDAVAGDGFGSAVSLSTRTALVGSGAALRRRGRTPEPRTSSGSRATRGSSRCVSRRRRRRSTRVSAAPSRSTGDNARRRGWDDAVGVRGSRRSRLRAAAHARCCRRNRASSPPTRRSSTSSDRAVAVDGDTMLVGALSHPADTTVAGAAYFYERSGGAWVQRQEVIPRTRTTAAASGWPWRSKATTAVIGAGFGQVVQSPGAAYVYTRTAGVWSLQTKLVPGGRRDRRRVRPQPSLSNRGTIVVGAPFDDDFGFSTGSVYVFVQNGTAGRSRRSSTPPAPARSSTSASAWRSTPTR